MTTLATFWAGSRLAALEMACLHSLVLRGYEVVLYSYDDIQSLPAGVTLRPAHDLAPRAYLNRFHYQGRPNYAHFADYFRWKIFEKTDFAWVDADILLLTPSHLIELPNLLIASDVEIVNNAVIKLDKNKLDLHLLIKNTEDLMDRDLLWGATGPRLLVKTFGLANEMFEHVYPENTFFPIHYDDIWKVLLPEYADECEGICRGAIGLHLYNNILTRIGIWKDLAPPVGSYLWNRLKEDDSLRFFEGTYPEPVMGRMIENFHFRSNGKDVTLRALATRLVPALMHSVNSALYRRWGRG
ncbi:hypothetical protein [Methylobacterium aerolatum]|uniref:Alpha 1,4-glycosyltransferase domain-containing protein n=1 Tax=Methylobacterium aerolatum TaxID=418708 RepID=A0ABU0I3J7_9HYPH|nr:hypothetical protein [Methylobacterium aerolatum]MDQ0449177.1 hypothetical protein [Methylobacterium aerolatum]GJD35364.1 hypothetical protein FMGBMHLM_2274 [Methylobacterium aerolatum]